MASLSRPTQPTLYHATHFSSSRPLGVLMELGLVPKATPSSNDGPSAAKKPKNDDALIVQVQTITYEQLKNDPVLISLNPQKRLPFFYDPQKNLALTESGGLVQYLLETYDTKHTLHPEIGHETRADFLQLLHFGPATAYHVTVPILFEGQDLDKRKKEFCDILVPTLEGTLTKYGGPFLLGDKLSAVDVSLAYDLLTIDSSKHATELWTPHPKLKAYHDRISELDFYRAVFPKKG